MIEKWKWGIGVARLFAVASLVAVASCGPIVELPGSGEAPRLFDLIPTAPPPSPATTPKSTVLMEALSMPSSLRTDQIVVRPSTREVKYLSDVRWSERAATLLYRYLRTTFESSNSLQVVANNTLEVASDYRMRIEILDFSLHTDAAVERGNVRVQASALLLRNGPAEIIGSKQFTADKDVIIAQGAEEIAAAFNAALDRLSIELLNWTEQEIANAQG